MLNAIKIAVVGSGPAGFYTTQKLIKNANVCVDIYEKLPVPFGLVRYGVAPDHSDVKNVMKSFSKIATKDQVNFYGNVHIGTHIKLEDLLSAYHAVVLAYGSSVDRKLGIPGEASRNTISARNFVGWYNGLPEDRDLDVNLDCDTACIVGNGNVALDCARILSDSSRLTRTDITASSLEALKKSRIRKIIILGRRGPVQSSFATKELRQLIELMPSRIKIDPHDIFDRHGVTEDDLAGMGRLHFRKTKLLFDVVRAKVHSGSKHPRRVECIFKFLSVPSSIDADENDLVRSLVVGHTAFDSKESFLNNEAKPNITNETTKIPCGLIIKSIGYNANLIDSKLPYDPSLGAIINTDGRIPGFQNLYCSGWLATGASGVIAGTLSSSDRTATSILEDIRSNKLGRDLKEGSQILRGLKIVKFKDWEKIDQLELKLGDAAGKAREKFVSVDDMLKIIS